MKAGMAWSWIRMVAPALQPSKTRCEAEVGWSGDAADCLHAAA